MHRLGMLLIAGQGIALLVVYFFHWVSAALAINLFVVLPSILPMGNNSAKAPCNKTARRRTRSTIIDFLATDAAQLARQASEQRCRNANAASKTTLSQAPGAFPAARITIAVL